MALFPAIDCAAVVVVNLLAPSVASATSTATTTTKTTTKGVALEGVVDDVGLCRGYRIKGIALRALSTTLCQGQCLEASC